jgi:TetR/AcrR family transcriptional repressor of nem operon
MARISDTREQIMDRAADLLTTKGFNGFSYRDISMPMGVKNAAIHYHFPSKTDLGLALVEQFHHILRSGTAEFMAYGGKALPQLKGLFSYTQHQVSCGNSLCPIGAMSVEFEDLPDEVKKTLKDLHTDTSNWLTRVLETGRAQDEFQFEGDAEARALTMLAALQGARQIARFRGAEVLTDVITQLRTDLGITA